MYWLERLKNLLNIFCIYVIYNIIFFLFWYISFVHPNESNIYEAVRLRIYKGISLWTSNWKAFVNWRLLRAWQSKSLILVQRSCIFVSIYLVDARTWARKLKAIAGDYATFCGCEWASVLARGANWNVEQSKASPLPGCGVAIAFPSPTPICICIYICRCHCCNSSEIACFRCHNSDKDLSILFLCFSCGDTMSTNAFCVLPFTMESIE